MAGKEPLPNDGILVSFSGGALDIGAAARLLPYFCSSIRCRGFNERNTFCSIYDLVVPVNKKMFTCRERKKFSVDA